MQAIAFIKLDITWCFV